MILGTLHESLMSTVVQTTSKGKAWEERDCETILKQVCASMTNNIPNENPPYMVYLANSNNKK
jgi:hypothetical protein